MLKFLLFAHEPDLLRAADDAGIENIVIDWEQRGKYQRQSGYHLEQNILGLPELVTARKIFNGMIACRINPIDDNSLAEINNAIDAGADCLILPMFRTVSEVEKFVDHIDGRVKSSLLFETKESVNNSKLFASMPIDEIYVGLNDLAISLGLKFPFQAVNNGHVDKVRESFPDKKFGFGAITVLGKGCPISTKMILAEMARLTCDKVILRRAFKRDCEPREWKKEVERIKSEYDVLAKRTEEEIEFDRLRFHSAVEEVTN